MRLARWRVNLVDKSRAGGDGRPDEAARPRRPRQRARDRDLRRLRPAHRRGAGRLAPRPHAGGGARLRRAAHRGELPPRDHALHPGPHRHPAQGQPREAGAPGLGGSPGGGAGRRVGRRGRAPGSPGHAGGGGRQGPRGEARGRDPRPPGRRGPRLAEGARADVGPDAARPDGALPARRAPPRRRPVRHRARDARAADLGLGPGRARAPTWGRPRRRCAPSSAPTSSRPGTSTSGTACRRSRRTPSPTWPSRCSWP